MLFDASPHRFVISCVGPSGRVISDGSTSSTEIILQGCGSYDEEDDSPAVDPRLFKRLDSTTSETGVAYANMHQSVVFISDLQQ